ncbi:hypothetical protein D4764_01G0000050 [Takifugu flavidus]|uniref:Tc1-like transposase DDE domain-containing protein n=1 Tax=Takifugu flavidus TaxID=433684 RepID=A0A5C6PPJ3_9TELE|nr:hypothetical protein D4764_01G0000050 [Takifugu flavidus]
MRDETDHAQALITVRVDTVGPEIVQVPQQTARAQHQGPKQATTSTGTRDLAYGQSPQQTTVTAETQNPGQSTANAGTRDETEGRAQTPLQPTTKRAVATMTDPTGQHPDWYFDSPNVEPPREHRVRCKCLRKTKDVVLNEDSLLREDSEDTMGRRTPIGVSTLLDLGGLFDESQNEEARHEKVAQIPQGPSSFEEDGFEDSFDHFIEPGPPMFQRMMELEASEPPCHFIYMDEAGFNLTKRRRRGRNLIGHRATIDVPGQRGGNITMCAAISDNGVLTHIPLMGPYNSERLIAFLDTLFRDHILGGPAENMAQPKYAIIWDNVSFHKSNLVRQWYANHNRMVMEFLPPYSPFLNPIEEFFSAWRWKVYDREPHTQVTLLAAMDAACQDITADSCRAWIRHARRYYPRCLAREDIRCDVDENLWPNRQEREEAEDQD